ncbi:MAG: phosphoenolpyruvate synthase, partial [Microlunatus sp.]|nr:phosphoenolpyruvate synthase [Microlunatus sp.]
YRVARSIVQCIPRNPSGWAGAAATGRYRDEAAALSALDLGTLDWVDLIPLPRRVARTVDLVTDVRVDYLPSAGVALGQLRLLLSLLRRNHLFGDLIAGAPTATHAANDQLNALAAEVETSQDLRDAFEDPDTAGLLRFVRTDSGASDFRQHFAEFIDRYGHRETSSLLLVHDPTWRDAPATVLDLIRVLRAGGDLVEERESRASAALTGVLDHRVVRRFHAAPLVRRLVSRAAAGIALREDTHYEATRLMPVVRHVVNEAGLRLAQAGTLARSDDVWFLTWPEVAAAPDPDSAEHCSTSLQEISDRRRQAHSELAATPLIATSTLYPDRRFAEDTLVSGTAAGGGRVVGPVRVVHDSSEFAQLRPGDVLVCLATNPSWTPLFARAAAVVVDHGGLASHAAIVAREYGIPAVMGTGNGTSVLHDEEQVQVDGAAGTVTHG